MTNTPPPASPLSKYRLMEEPVRLGKPILIALALLLVTGLGAAYFIYCGNLKSGASQDSYCSEAKWRVLLAKIAPVSPPGGACGGWLPNRCPDGYRCLGGTPKRHGLCQPSSI